MHWTHRAHLITHLVRHTARTLRWSIGLVAVMSITAGCTISAGTGGPPGATATPTPPPCNTHATTTAIAWGEGQQIHGGIGGAAPAQLSNFSYPLGLPDEGFSGNQTVPGYVAISPDGHHIAVDEDVFVPFTEEVYPYVVDTSTHAVARVMLPAYPFTPDEEPRLLAWADNHTLIVFQGLSNRGGSSTNTYAYDISTNSATPLPGITGAVEGEVRCSTLYWMDLGTFTVLSGSDPNHTSKAPERIHRYDLTSHTEIGSPITISDASTYGGAEGQVDYAGWDVSRDNTKLVYQHMTVTFSGGNPHQSSQFFAANADGTGATQILTGPPPVTSTTGARLSISPDGTKVAVTNAQGTPTVATGPTSGTGGTLFYSPDASGQPAWLSDNSGFLATVGVESEPPNDIYQYLLATPPVGGRVPGTEVHAAGTDPATLP
jgi:hypothetical protein